MNEQLWYRDRQALAFIALRYLPWLAVLNLLWEIAQLPLYTIWNLGTRTQMAFAVLHCTLGDVLIGTAALALALTLTRSRAFAAWRWDKVIPLLLVFGVGYTVFSEWLNTTLLRWTYSALMPTLSFNGFELGMSPVVQWFVVPLLALYGARSMAP